MKPADKIVFFGTPEFTGPALEALLKAGYEIAAVITQPDKPVGRGLKMEAPVVKVKAEELGLKVLQPKTLGYTEAELPGIRKLGFPVFQQLGNLSATIGVCVAYGKIIPKAVLELFPRGVLNIHPSLLPKYRGPSPIQNAILSGDAETGVTIMLLDEEMDHGPILAQSPPLRLRGGGEELRQPTGGELSQILAQSGAELLLETLPRWLAGEINPQPQDHDKATFTKILTRDDGRIDWNKPAEYLERQVRAYDLWPGTFTLWAGKRLKILNTALLHPTIGCASNSTPGYVWKTVDGHLAVNCNPGAIILEQLQLEGKKSMTGAEFLRGYPKFIGSILV